jgi:hypothetical protein
LRKDLRGFDITLCRERKQSLINAREFLLELCDTGPQLSKKELRHRIKYILKHWPWPTEITFLPDIPSEAAQVCFKVLKMIEQGVLDQNMIEVVLSTTDEDPEDSNNCTQPSPSQKPHKHKPKSPARRKP